MHISFGEVFLMGSLPEGTLCAYCGVEEAGYIPDGACGPMCPDCLELPEEKACGLRWGRLWPVRIAPLCSALVASDDRGHRVLTDPVISLVVASFIIPA